MLDNGADIQVVNLLPFLELVAKQQLVGVARSIKHRYVMIMWTMLIDPINARSQCGETQASGDQEYICPYHLLHREVGAEWAANTNHRPGFQAMDPTGNLANALACIMARELGLPIGTIVLATNANRTIPEYFETLEWIPRASVQTLASAMDVGDPSNMERLRNIIGEADILRDCLGVLSVDDKQIEAEIRRDFEDFGFATCPHTATATHTWRQLDNKLRDANDWILVATAHPAKFETIVEPLIGEAVPLPEELADILSRPSHAVSISPWLDSLADAMDEYFN